MGSKNATLRPLDKTNPEADAAERFNLTDQQLDDYEAAFQSAAQGADTITKSQFDKIVQITERQNPDEDDDVAGLGISKRTMVAKWPEFLLCACFLFGSRSHAMILCYFVVADLDGDGRLSKREIRDVFTKFLATKKRRDRRHAAEGLSYEERDQLQRYTDEFVRHADKNKNGFIELEEFMSAWSSFGDRIDSILS